MSPMRNLYSKLFLDAICSDIKKAKDNAVLGGSVILTYSAIDAMAFMSMPASQKEVHRQDFVAWVDRHMKTDAGQSYQYRGIDLYGARCGIVHRYGVESRLSDAGLCNIFAYHDGGDHIFNPQKHQTLILISIPRLTQDFFKAVQLFLGEMGSDPLLKARVDSRIPRMFIVSKASSAAADRT